MSQKISKNKNFLLFLWVVSLITSPVVVLIIALFLGNKHEIEKKPEYFIVFIVTCFTIPVALRFMQTFRYKVKTNLFGVLAKENRDPIYLACFVSSILSYILFSSENLDNVVWFNLSILLAIYMGIFFIINRFFHKASQHAGSFVLSIIYLSIRIDTKILFFLAFLPLIWLSRYYLKAHTYIELVLGTIIGILVGILSINVL